MQWLPQNHLPTFGQSIVAPQLWNVPGPARLVMAKDRLAHFHFKFAAFDNPGIGGIQWPVIASTRGQSGESYGYEVEDALS